MMKLFPSKSLTTRAAKQMKQSYPDSGSESTHPSIGGHTHGTSIVSEGLLEENLRTLYDYPASLEEKFQVIRDRDFASLDENNCVYLDYTGTMLAPKQLVDQHHKLLTEQVLGNPHSQNSPSLLSSEFDQLARKEVLSFINADPREYEVVWTSNASGALRIIGECYPFTRGGAFLYAPDCHNSVLGITAFAKAKHARTGGFGLLGTSLCYDFSSYTKRMGRLGSSLIGSSSAPRLVGMPGESNSSGYRHDTRRYVDHAHRNGWDVLVDCAALMPTNEVDVEELGKPDFLCASFYKIFGYPTGVGCLIAKRSALKRFQKPWFAGGTVRLVGVSIKECIPFSYSADRHEQYEDGTINFQGIAAVLAGIQYMKNEIGMKNLERHVQFFSELLETRLRCLRWDNGCPVVKIPQNVTAQEKRGHALAIVFLTRSGRLLPHKIVEEIFSSRGIAVRTGCFCNPGSSLQILERHLDMYGSNIEGFVNKHLRRLSNKGRLEEVIEKNANQGYVRVSFGIPTNRADIDAFVAAVEEGILSRPDEIEKLTKQFLATCSVPHSLC